MPEPSTKPFSPPVRLPRKMLLVICAELTALAYYLILFTNVGNLYHGGSYGGVVVTQAVAVLAIFSCVEVMRTEKVTAFRALAGAFGVPLVLVTLLMLWYGVRRYLQT
jgi:pantothenate kinase